MKKCTGQCAYWDGKKRCQTHCEIEQGHEGDHQHTLEDGTVHKWKRGKTYKYWKENCEVIHEKQMSHTGVESERGGE